MPPIVALAIGWLIVGEPFHVLDAAGIALIIVGVGGRATRRSPTAAAATPETAPHP